VVSLISRCEKLGLVQRQVGRKDRREVEVHLTPRGNDVLNALAGQHRDELLRLQGIFRVPGVDELMRVSADLLFCGRPAIDAFDHASSQH